MIELIQPFNLMKFGGLYFGGLEEIRKAKGFKEGDGNSGLPRINPF